MRFPDHYVSLIMECVTTVSYEILINGVPTSKFHPKCGLRQGDPLSPYLFALCMEVLSSNIEHGQQRGDLQGIRICRNALPITHLLFADDSIFFLEGKSTNCETICNIIDDYCEASGQKINTEKSAIICSPNMTNEARIMIQTRTRIRICDSLGTYLGLPTDFGKTKKTIFNEVFEKVIQRISSWNGVLLSPAGRLTLISSILSSLSNYFLSVFKIPVSVAQKINSALSHFWWAGLRDKKTIHWCSKTFLSFPKSNGGLGIRNIGCLNQAMLAKQAWRLLSNPCSLMSQALMAKYILPGRSPEGGLLFKRANSSWGWKGMLWGIELVYSGIAWKVGFPSELSIWNTRWVDGETPPLQLDDPETSFTHSIFTKVKDIQKQGGGWNTDLINLVFNEEWRVKILAIPAMGNPSPDLFYWKFADTGKYTVKSGYGQALSKLIEQKASTKDRNRVPQLCKDFIKKRLWRLPGPMKWRILLWKIMMDCLPIGKEFDRRNIPLTTSCPMCADEGCMETLDHLFRDCPVAQRVWQGSNLGIRCDHGNTLDLKRWITNWLVMLDTKPDLMESTLTFMAVLWTLWRERNNLVFKGIRCVFPTIMSTLQDLSGRAIARHKQESRDTGYSEAPSEIERARSSTPLYLIGERGCSAYTIMVDAAWKSKQMGGLGWVVRDENGFIAHYVRKKMVAECPLQAEAIAIKEALSWAITRGILHLALLTDCLQVVLQLAELQDPSHYVGIILPEIVKLSACFHCFSICYIPRKLNKVAHRLAQEAKQM